MAQDGAPLEHAADADLSPAALAAAPAVAFTIQGGDGPADNSARNPASTKRRSVVSASVRRSSRMITKLLQSVNE